MIVIKVRTWRGGGGGGGGAEKKGGGKKKICQEANGVSKESTCADNINL